MSDRLATVIIVVVTLVWVVNFFARFVVPGYQPSEAINGIFMAIVGSIFAFKGRRRGRRDDDEDDERY